jgi:hypothetical protein
MPAERRSHDSGCDWLHSARAGPSAHAHRVPASPVASCGRPQLVWSVRTALACYSLMVVGYALYLTVGFNFIMGDTVRMKHVGLRPRARAQGRLPWRGLQWDHARARLDLGRARVSD